MEKQAIESKIESLYQEFKKLNEKGESDKAEEKFNEMLALMEKQEKII